MDNPVQDKDDDETILLNMKNRACAPYGSINRQHTDKHKVKLLATSININKIDDGMYLLKSELSSFTAKKIELATKLSLIVNLALFSVKILVFVETGSFAVVAALTDSFCDLISQIILYYTQKSVRTFRAEFPAGRTRLEPVGILIMSILMIILSCSVIFGSILTLINIYTTHTFVVNYSLCSVILLATAIISKFCLWLFCKQFTSSPSAMALAEDHRNDVLSNGTALIAVCIASQVHNAVWADPVGAILISTYIIWAWWSVGIEESNKLIGIEPNDDDLNKINLFLNKQLNYNKIITEDKILNVHHIGRNLLCELRLIIKKTSNDHDYDFNALCDFCSDIQYKLELFDFVERAYVTFDYMQRNRKLHKIPILD